jgi:hypothetical protein
VCGVGSRRGMQVKKGKFGPALQPLMPPTVAWKPETGKQLAIKDFFKKKSQPADLPNASGDTLLPNSTTIN